MTDKQLAFAIANARVAVSHMGSMHALWDVIFDAEAILAGRPAILTREQVEKHLEQYRP